MPGWRLAFRVIDTTLLKPSTISTLSVLTLAGILISGCAAPRRLSKTEHITELYAGRQDGLVRVDKWLDEEGGGGIFLLTTADVTELNAIHTNQPALGGGSTFSTGPVSIKVDPQTGAIIEATGSAVGNIVGAAVKKAAGVP